MIRILFYAARRWFSRLSKNYTDSKTEEGVPVWTRKQIARTTDWLHLPESAAERKARKRLDPYLTKEAREEAQETKDD